MGVVLREAWSESQWTVLVGYLAISINVSSYIKHVLDDNNFVFCQRSAPARGCAQHSSTAAARNSQLDFSCVMPPGSPELNSVDYKI